MSDPITIKVGLAGLTDLANRFILETNTFLSRHWNERRVWWPRKLAPEDVGGPCGSEASSADATVPPAVATDAEELVSRLIRSCRVLHPQAQFTGHPRYAIVLVLDAEQAQPIPASDEAADIEEHPVGAVDAA